MVCWLVVSFVWTVFKKSVVGFFVVINSKYVYLVNMRSITISTCNIQISYCLQCEYTRRNNRIQIMILLYHFLFVTKFSRTNRTGNLLYMYPFCPRLSSSLVPMRIFCYNVLIWYKLINLWVQFSKIYFVLTHLVVIK